jgi:hypothetical protein
VDVKTGNRGIGKAETLKRLPDLTALRAVISNGARKGDKLPTRIKVFAWGDNPSTKGNFCVGEGTAKTLSANQHALGFDRVAIDYNHCTVEGSPEYVKGQPKAIFGYGRPNVVKGDGIYLEDIEWTPLGAKNARNYEDLSPAAHQEDGQIDFIHSVALTPNGCLYDVTFFSASGGDKTNDDVMSTPNTAVITLAALAGAMGLAATATEAETMGRLQKLNRLSALEPLLKDDKMVDGLIKDGKVIILDQVARIDSRVAKLEDAGTKAIATLSATIGGKVITITAEDVVTLSSRLDSIEQQLKGELAKVADTEKTKIISLLSAEGKAPINPETSKAYTGEELRKCDVTLLRVLHANTPATVPLSARGRQVTEGKTTDGLKGREKMIAAFESQNRGN